MPPSGDEKRCWFALIFREAIYPETFKQVVEEAKSPLGYPISAREEVDEKYLERKITIAHSNVTSHLNEILSFQTMLLNTARRELDLIKALGSRSKKEK